MYRAVSKTGCQTMAVVCNVLPEGLSKTFWMRLKSVTAKKIIKSLSRYAKIVISLLQTGTCPVQPLTIIFGGGLRSISSCLNCYPVTEKTQKIYIHQLDYDIYLNQKETKTPKKNQVVFLDEYFPFHPDYICSGTDSPCLLYTSPSPRD